MAVRILAPRDGAAADLTTQAARQWMERRRTGASAAGGEPFDYLSPEMSGTERSLSAVIPLRWEGADGEARVEAWPERFPEERTVLTARGGSCGLRNLRLGERYLWRVTGPDGDAAQASFVTSREPPRLLTVPNVSNVRDAGGWRVPGGRVRQGMVLRGGEMDSHQRLAEEGRRILCEDLGVRTDADLRREAELACSPLGEGKLRRIVMGAYDDLVLSDGAAVKEFFDLLAYGDPYPVYVHCWGGADRTGCLILLLNAALGVCEEDLILDYELTSLSIWGVRSAQSELFRKFLAALEPYGPEGAALPVRCAAFLRSVGVGEEQILRLRGILTEPD